jgi:hypothetical protein
VWHWRRRIVNVLGEPKRFVAKPSLNLAAVRRPLVSGYAEIVRIVERRTLDRRSGEP